MLADDLDVLLVEADPLEAELLLRSLGELAQCYQAGANSCIVKPIEFRELAETLRELGRYWLRLNRPAPSGAGAPSG
jgi:CheY-like chemotaxis protein